MSSTDYMECPNCGNEAWIDNDRWAEHIFCNQCGFTKQTFVTNLDEVALGALPQVETHLIDKPYGAYYVAYKDGTADAGTLNDEAGKDALMVEIGKYFDEIIDAYTTHYIDGKFTKTVLVGGED